MELRKILIYIAIIVGVIGILYALVSVFIHSDRVSEQNRVKYYAVGSCLRLYIKANNGLFPESQDDLIKQELVKIEIDDMGTERYNFYYYDKDVSHWGKECDEHDYDFKCEGHDYGFMEIKDINEFSIRYGFKLEDGTLIDENLYDTNTEEEILLVDCPAVKKWGNDLTTYLYEAMQSSQKDGTKTGIPEASTGVPSP